MGYISPAPHKTGAGICNLLTKQAHNRASGFFTCDASPHLFRIMAGRTGEPKGSPGSCLAGIANPVRLATPRFATLGGELSQLTKQGYPSWQTANHAIPTLTLSVFILIPKSIAACSVPNVWFAACILRPSATAVLWLNCACRLFSAIWLTTCGICGSSRKNPDSNPPENLKQTRHSASSCWWGVALADIQEAP
ncbi:ash family protein [Salmonella enterica]|nr:ash family protein [Salmonella enterica]EJC8331220.1 ash family protein [Salmonella enterica]EJR8724202.1 ash family protein [Salmonella enterica]EJX2518861.1 ash family protein [Salmonella enterica]EKC6884808.1 ash family protein [Salmonella enterica]